MVVKIARFWCLVRVRVFCLHVYFSTYMYSLENVVYLFIFFCIFLLINSSLYCAFYRNLRKIKFQFYSFYEEILEFVPAEWINLILNISTGKESSQILSFLFAFIFLPLLCNQNGYHPPSICLEN